MNNPRSISIFGVTGSIGISTQEVILLNKNNFIVDTIVANEDVRGLIKAAILLKANLRGTMLLIISKLINGLVKLLVTGLDVFSKV